MLTYIQLIGGLVVLFLGGEFFVRGAVAFAKNVGVPPLVIGLTIVAFGTSAPELIVSVEAAINGFPGISIGNVVGSNIANVLLVLGVPALIMPIACHTASLDRDIFVMLGASALFIGFCMSRTLVTWQGAILVALLAAFLIHSYATDREESGGDSESGKLPQTMTWCFSFLAIGLVGLLFGSHILVEGAVGVSRAWGVSEAVIGLTLVAVGTSLPELATTVVAAIRKQGGIAIGNVVGSNVFNILGVIGVTALVVPVPVPEQIFRFDLWVMMGTSLLLLPIALRRIPIGRSIGAIFLVGYVGFFTAQYLGLFGHTIETANLVR